jgi:hypothetical protein
MADLRSVFVNLQGILRDLFTNLPQEQSLGLQQLYEQVWNASADSEDWMWLVDLYIDERNGSISALFAKDGKLFMSPVTIADTGAVLGQLQEVKTEFQPIANSIRVHQGLNGEPDRWFLIASSTVLNRMGYFNSQELFDNLIKHSVDTGKYPYLTFMHLGEAMKMGMTDWVARDGNIMLASGTFEDNEIARLMKQAWIAEPDYWGSSISFWPSAHRMLTIAEGIDIPVYTDGDFEEISTLPELDACCLMTAMVAQRKVKQGMDKRVEDALLKLAGGDAHIFEDLKAKVDGANTQIQTEGLLHQAASPADDTTPVVEPVVTASVVEPADRAQQELVLDESLTLKIVEQLASHPSVLQTFAASEVRLAAMEQSLTEIQAKLDGFLVKTDQRLAVIETPVAQQVDETLKNLSRSQLKPKVVYRPSEQTPDPATPAHKQSAAEIAEQTLANIK